nr:MAG TPA: hypothetical protein [Caudoviricetes sp.]
MFISGSNINYFTPCGSNFLGSIGSPVNARNTRLGIFVSAEAMNLPLGLSTLLFEFNSLLISSIDSFVYTIFTDTVSYLQ